MFKRRSILGFVLPVVLLLGVFSFNWYPRVEPYSYRIEQETEGAEIVATIEFLQSRLQRNPESAVDHLSLANAYLARANFTNNVSFYDLAEKHAVLSLKLRPYLNEGATLVQAKVYEARHQFKKAITTAQNVLRDNPDSIGALKVIATSSLGSVDSALAIRSAKNAMGATKTVELLTIVAMAELAGGNREHAIATIKKAIKFEGPRQYRSSAFSRTFLGKIYLQSGEIAQARAYFDEALRILPNYHLALAGKAELEEKRGRLTAAAELYQKAYASLAEPPYLIKQAALSRELGNLLGSHEQFSKAEDAIRSEMYSGPYGHHNELAMLLLARGHAKDINEAKQEAIKEISIRPTASSFYLLARSNFVLGDAEEAQRAINKALATGSKDPEVLALARSIRVAELAN